MKKKLLIGFLLVIFLAGGLATPLLAASTVDDYIPDGGVRYYPGQEIVSERGRNHRVFYEGDGVYRAEFVGSPEFTESNGEWVDYVFTDGGSYYQVQHPWSSARFYDYYTEVWNEEFSEVRVYDDRWSVEYLNKQSNWVDADFYSIIRSYEIVSDGIKLRRTGNTDIGERVDTYYYRDGSPCKIEIKITPAEAQTVRYVWNQSGIVASGELSEVDEETGRTKGMRFTGVSGKNVWICRWVDELNIVDTVSVTAESHARGRKATVIFESITVEAGSAAILDPDTFYPDPHEETYSVDGLVRHNVDEGNYTWSSLRTQAGTDAYDSSASEKFVGMKAEADTNRWELLYRAIFLFNTESLPDGAPITAATLSLHGWDKYDPQNRDPDINIYSSAPASNTALAAGDFDSLGVTAYCDTTITHTAFNIGGYNDFAFNAAGIAAISKTSVSKFSARDATHDVGGSAPTWGSAQAVSYLSGRYAEYGAGFKPKLVVTYTIVPPAVTTQAASSVEDTTATGNGNITDTGGENADWRGIVYDLASHGDPGNVHPSASGYSDNQSSSGSFGTGAFTESLTGLLTGRTYYARAWAHNSGGYAYGGEINFLTKPAAPTNVAASDGSSTANVTITWTKSTGATGYRVYEGVNLLDTLGDVATYDDTAAPAGTISNSGAASASDGTSGSHVILSLAGEATTNGASRTYKVVASNATGDSDDSLTDTGYRGVGAITYQWQRSAADSDAAYGNIGGATTDPYNDVGAPEFPEGRWYRCIVSSTGASNSPQTSTADRGFRALGSPTVTTQVATNIEDTTATGNGNITATGGENADWRGIVYDLASHGAPGDVHPSASGYSDNQSSSGSFGTGAFTESLTGLPTGDTIYARAWAHNSAGYSYGAEINFLTKPAAPTNVAATDGVHTDKVVITWTKSTGATDYHVWRGAVDLGAAGDVATFDDVGADAGTITPGTASASDGTVEAHVILSLAGEGTTNGTTHTYKVVASNATGDSDDSLTDTGYRGVGAITYQWQRSAADSDAAYGNIGGATTDPYNDAGAPANGDGRWYLCLLDATGAAQAESTHDRGFRGTRHLVLYIDEIEQDATQLLSGGVPGNANNWVFLQNNVIPYADNISISVNSTQQLYFAPNAIIIGTNLPDRSGDATSNNGTIFWGANPTGVTITVDSLTPLDAYGAGEEALVSPDVAPEISPPDLNPSGTTAKQGWQMFAPFMTAISAMTNTPLEWTWEWINGLITLILIVLMFKVTNNVWMAGLGGLVGIGIGLGMGVFAGWMLIVAVIIVIGVALLDRTTSL